MEHINMLKIISYLKIWLRIKLNQKIFQKRMKYMYFDNHSDRLLIIFNAFGGEKPKYNYIRGLRDIKNIDFLYILDDFGYTGSYLLYENGDNNVEKMTTALITDITNKKIYKQILTAGSSKGGTCALYFGLIFNASAIFSGACQYNLGSYLHRSDHERIFKGMMGNDAGIEEAELLNSVMPKQLEKYSKTYNGSIHIIFSKKDLTYERQLIDLIHQLTLNHYSFYELESDYERHEDIGRPFLNYLRDYLLNGVLK